MLQNSFYGFGSIFVVFGAVSMHPDRKLGCAQGLEQNLNVRVHGLESVFS